MINTNVKLWAQIRLLNVNSDQTAKLWTQIRALKCELRSNYSLWYLIQKIAKKTTQVLTQIKLLSIIQR